MVRALILFLLLPAAAPAEVPARYRQAAAEYGLPAKVVYAVALTESGMQLQSGRARPWPWTLNIEGRGHYYPTRKAAYQALKVYLDRGSRRADVGLMQIHWRAHHRLLRDLGPQTLEGDAGMRDPIEPPHPRFRIQSAPAASPA